MYKLIHCRGLSTHCTGLEDICQEEIKRINFKPSFKVFALYVHESDIAEGCPGLEDICQEEEEAAEQKLAAERSTGIQLRASKNFSFKAFLQILDDVVISMRYAFWKYLQLHFTSFK